MYRGVAVFFWLQMRELVRLAERREADAKQAITELLEHRASM
jgi:hypothetical protein